MLFGNGLFEMHRYYNDAIRSEYNFEGGAANLCVGVKPWMTDIQPGDCVGTQARQLLSVLNLIPLHSFSLIVGFCFPPQ